MLLVAESWPVHTVMIFGGSGSWFSLVSLGRKIRRCCDARFCERVVCGPCAASLALGIALSEPLNPHFSNYSHHVIFNIIMRKQQYNLFWTGQISVLRFDPWKTITPRIRLSKRDHYRYPASDFDLHISGHSIQLLKAITCTILQRTPPLRIDSDTDTSAIHQLKPLCIWYTGPHENPSLFIHR